MSLHNTLENIWDKTEAKLKILIVEDDAALAEGLRLNLELSGFAAITAYSIGKAMEQLQAGDISLLLLDVNLPDGDGVSFGKRIRSKQDIPMIFLTAKDMDEDMIAGFMAGADDYITKPFNIQVLLQRVQAVLRRYCPAEAEKNQWKGGNLEIDFDSYTVLKKGEPLALTPTEFKLLAKFCQNPGIVLTRQVLIDELWDQEGNFVDEHTLTIFVSRLRTKIADEEYSYIRTVYGTGYCFAGEGNG